ncbi:hypothetical protein ACWATR_06830 [Nostoc sp. UIC 10890]
MPRMAYFTGDLNIHDLEFGREGLWIVNTHFFCLDSRRQLCTTLASQIYFPISIRRLVPPEWVSDGFELGTKRNPPSIYCTRVELLVAIECGDS